MPRNNSRSRRESRQQEAKARQVKRNARSDKDQIVLLKLRRGSSARELARLT